jgi:hypothetical protein
MDFFCKIYHWFSGFDKNNWITLIGSLATLFTVLEMYKQRKRSQEPRLVFNSVYKKYVYQALGEHKSFSHWSDEKSIKILMNSNSSNPLIFKLYNIGKGVASEIIIDFSFDHNNLDAFKIKTIKKNEEWEVSIMGSHFSQINSKSIKSFISFINNDIKDPYKLNMSGCQPILESWLSVASQELKIPIKFNISIRYHDSHNKKLNNEYEFIGKVYSKTHYDGWGTECYVEFEVKRK